MRMLKKMVLIRRVSVGGTHRYCLKTSSECGIGNVSHLNCSRAAVARAQNSLMTSGCFHLAHGDTFLRPSQRVFGRLGMATQRVLLKNRLLRTHGLLKTTDLRPL